MSRRRKRESDGVGGERRGAVAGRCGGALWRGAAALPSLPQDADGSQTEAADKIPNYPINHALLHQSQRASKHQFSTIESGSQVKLWCVCGGVEGGGGGTLFKGKVYGC